MYQYVTTNEIGKKIKENLPVGFDGRSLGRNLSGYGAVGAAVVGAEHEFHC